MPDFLLEIGTEIPARMIDGAREELAQRVSDLLKREPCPSAGCAGLLDSAAARGGRLRRPEASTGCHRATHRASLKVAYKDGAPTPAARSVCAESGTCRSSALKKTTTTEGEYLAATVQRGAHQRPEILAETLPKEIAGIYWAKNMYWRGKIRGAFVRPLRWMVSLLDGESRAGGVRGYPRGQRQRRSSHPCRLAPRDQTLRRIT